MKRKIALTIFLLIITITANVFAATEVTMEIVEDNICTIDLNKESSFEKKIIDSNLEKHEVTLQLKISNNSEVIIPSGELMIVIDSSESMNTTVEGDTTRKDLVLNSANKLVENLLKANPTSLEIGVVTFSTGSAVNEEGYLITGTEADAQKVCDFTNDLSELTNKISAIEGTGPYTNLDSGLQLAHSQFSDDDSNKYMIILTDGLPNLAIGYNDLVSYEGITNVINQTKSTLSSLQNIEVITMLTGIDNEEATFRTDGTNTYTYGQVIQEVFGTEENSTIGKFYKIDDTEIEQTITNKIYHDLLPIENSLTDIVILDYFPKYITDNFDIIYHIEDEVNTEDVTILQDSENNQYISWKIAELAPKEYKTIKYTLSLKETFDEKIVGAILDTNEKVDITYKDFDGTDKTQNCEITPKIKLVAVVQPEPEKPNDVTVAPDPIPDAGSPMFTMASVLIVIAIIFFGYKSRKIS